MEENSVQGKVDGSEGGGAIFNTAVREASLR